MKNKINNIILIIFSVLALTGCRSIQPILVLKPIDMILIPIVYLVLSMVFSKIISMFFYENRNFWLWFVLNLILTPLFGVLMIIYRTYTDSIKNK